MPKISILILTKNEASNIERSVGAAFDQDTTLPFEVVVVDSGSTDGTLEMLAKYPIKLVQIPPSAFHHSRTRNLLAESSQGEFLVYLGGDAWPTSRSWLSNLVEPFADTGVGGVYGRQIPKPWSSIERKIALAQMYGAEKQERHINNRNGKGFQFYHFSTVNCALRRDVWERFRFPEQQKIFEDAAMGKSILDAGLKIVYTPSAEVYHSHEHSASKLFRRYFDLGVVWQQLGMSDAESVGSLRSAGVQGIFRKFAELRAAGCGPSGLAHSLVRDIAKGGGFFLGHYQRHLPMPLKRRFSDVQMFD
jgi:rhamnosyltransferase